MDYNRLTSFLNEISTELDDVLPAMEQVYLKLKKYRGNIKNIQSELEFIKQVATNNPEILKIFSEVVPIHTEKTPKGNVLDLRIDDIASKFSIRVFNALKARGIHTIRELVKWTPHDLMQTRNFGKVSLFEVESVLGSLGVSLKEQ